MIRPAGHILLDLEVLLEELVDDHDLQYADVLGLVHAWLEVHRPGAKEVYTEDNSSPIYYYGPRPEGRKDGNEKQVSEEVSASDAERLTDKWVEDFNRTLASAGSKVSGRPVPRKRAKR